jgi:hypothetical protein
MTLADILPTLSAELDEAKNRVEIAVTETEGLLRQVEETKARFADLPAEVAALAHEAIGENALETLERTRTALEDGMAAADAMAEAVVADLDGVGDVYRQTIADIEKSVDEVEAALTGVVRTQLDEVLDVIEDQARVTGETVGDAMVVVFTDDGPETEGRLIRQIIDTIRNLADQLMSVVNRFV